MLAALRCFLLFSGFLEGFFKGVDVGGGDPDTGRPAKKSMSFPMLYLVMIASSPSIMRIVNMLELTRKLTVKRIYASF